MAHDSQCENANTPPSDCDCECGGSKHGNGFAEEQIHDLETDAVEIAEIDILRRMTPDEYFSEDGRETVEKVYAEIVEKIEESDDEEEIERLKRDKERLENVSEAKGKQLGKYVDISDNLNDFYKETRRYEAGSDGLEMELNELESFVEDYQSAEGAEKRHIREAILTNAPTLMKRIGDTEELEGEVIRSANYLSEEEMETAEDHVDTELIEENRERREEIENRVREIIKNTV